MPYLKDWSRRAELAKDQPKLENGAEFNFVISYLADEFIERHGLSYHTLEEIIGALEAAKQEFLHRVVDPYEAMAANRNGDVYLHTAALLEAHAEALTGAGLPTTYQEIKSRL